MGTRRDTLKYSKATIFNLGLLISMIVMYLYFLNMSVVQVVMRTEFVEEQNNLNAEIASLEADYIKAQHTIASRVSTLEGYNTSTNKIFVSREQTSLVLGGR